MHRQHVPRILALLLGALTISPSAGGEVDELRMAIDLAIDRLDAGRLPSVTTTESDVVAAIDQTMSYFERGADPAESAAWMEYLSFDTLSDAIADQGGVAQRGRAAVDLRSRLVGPEEGLEQTSLIRLRNSLDHYIAALQFADPQRSLKRLAQQLAVLKKQLDVPGNPNTDAASDSSSSDTQGARPNLASLSQWSPSQVAEIDALIGTLRDANQAEPVVEFIRSRFSSPNMYLWVSGQEVSKAILRPVNESTPVRDCILGTRLIGHSRLVGQVTASLLPQPDYVRILVRMDGHFHSDTRGFKGPVSLDSNSVGDVYVARQVAITQRAITLGDVISRVRLATQINRVNHPLRIVRKIAAKQAQQSKPRADAIARSRLEQRVEGDFRRQTDQIGDRSFPNLDDLMRPWLRRLDMPEPQREISSTPSAVTAWVRLQRPTGLAAPGPPPPIESLAWDAGPLPHRSPQFVIQVHETVLANSVSGTLAGTTFTPRDLTRLKSAIGVPIDGGDSEPKENFEVDFRSVRPIYFEARDGQLRIGIRGTRFESEKGEINQSLDVAAVYRPVVQDDATMILARDAKIDLAFTGSRRLTLQQTALKANVVNGFMQLFPTTLLHNALQIPTTFQFPALAGKTYRVVGVNCQDGWLSIGAAAL